MCDVFHKMKVMTTTSKMVICFLDSKKSELT